jgi:hypothetical protein
MVFGLEEFRVSFCCRGVSSATHPTARRTESRIASVMNVFMPPKTLWENNIIILRSQSASGGFVASSGRLAKGIFFGALAGAIDVIPMVFQKMTWDANLSAFSMWVAAGILISSTSLQMKGYAKGLLLSLLVAIPAAILVGWNSPASLLPMGIAVIVLGSLLGHFIDG